MSKTIQRPLACRNEHCGAMCSPADASFIDSPKECYKYERRDDLYLTNAIPIPEGATNGDVLKAVFPKAIIVDVGRAVNVEFSEDEENWFDKDWWSAPYKGVQNEIN